MSRDWVQINFPSFQSIRQSGCTHELGRPYELSWANKAEQVERVFIYALAPGETIPSVATTAEHVGWLLSERYDPKDAKPWNYNWYAVVQASSGDLYQSGPHRDIDFGHHLDRPPEFLTVKNRL